VGSRDVTVIIPARNAACSIARTLKSVEWQTLAPSRVLVVDDGSSDSTTEVVKRFSASSGVNISLLHTGGRGAGAARNEGLAQVSTPYVAFLDADDIWYPTKLEHQVPLTDDRRVVGCLMHYLSPRGAILGVNARFDSFDTATEALRSGRVMPLALSSWLVPTQRLIEIGGFDETFRRAQDLELGVRLTNVGMSLAWPRTAILLGYLIHASGATATSYREQFLAAELVRHRLAEGNAVAYEPWVASKSHSINLRRRALSGNYYRLAAVRSGQGRATAKWAAAAAALTLDPIEVLKKLKWQASRVSQEPAAAVPNAVLDLLNEI
jgi:glycosyltransferase involved in cell wall biosynthesis